MPRHIFISGLTALLACTAAGDAAAAEFKILEVPSIDAGTGTGPGVVAFSELRDDTAPAGLVSFETWASEKPVQKKFLSPYPSYAEPSANITEEGVTRAEQVKLRMYVAESRFTVDRPAGTIDLARYANVDFLERLDPAVAHKAISAGEADSTANKNPDRPWCSAANATCIQSTYKLEGKLPTAVHLVNQVSDNEKFSDSLEFQSELRILKPEDLDQEGLKKLTGIDTPIAGAIEQTIFRVNQIMQFGKFLAVVQESPQAPGEATITAFIALALKARLIDKAKKFESVPVLRNLVPGMVLTGKSSFNTGNSISAGLPIFARNNLKAVADILEGSRPTCPSQAEIAVLKLDGPEAMTTAASAEPAELEPDLLQPCRPAVDPFASAKACACGSSMLKQSGQICGTDAAAPRAKLLRAPDNLCMAAADAAGQFAAR